MATDSIGGLGRGTMLHSRYRLERLLGIGGMASVWLASDEQLDRSVAVKIIAEALAADPVWVRRFEREARAVASLGHPNIVRVFDFGSEQGRPFLVMEYVPGGTLANLLEGGGRVRAEDLARHLLDAVRHIHAAGLLHRDIKPANVLLSSDQTPLLTDFGIADHGDATRLTSTGNILGTFRYLAPEVLAGKPASARSDLFACGRLLGDVLSAGRPESRLVDLVQALTAENPALRPTSAEDALELLDQPPTADTRVPLTRVAERRLAQTRVLGVRETVALRRGDRLSAPARARRRAPRAPLAGSTVLVLVVVLVIVLVLASGGGRPASRAGAPQPAAASAPLSSQLDALSRRVRYASRR